jgi:AbrB family looped-hinge helix DNA binding protein
MHIATLTSKGQITLPLAVRAALGLTAGQKIDFLPGAIASAWSPCARTFRCCAGGLRGG